MKFLNVHFGSIYVGRVDEQTRHFYGGGSITVVTGTLGSGKTTRVHQLLAERVVPATNATYKVFSRKPVRAVPYLPPAANEDLDTHIVVYDDVHELPSVDAMLETITSGKHVIVTRKPEQHADVIDEYMNAAPAFSLCPALAAKF